MHRNRLFTISIGGGFVIVSLLAILAYLSLTRDQPDAVESRTTPSVEAISTDSPIPTLSPPLANVEFPTRQIDYPTGWPAGLHYPESFVAVDVSSGTLPEGSTMGWAAKLRYRGSPKSAIQELSSFLATNRWQISESTELDSGGVLLLIAKGDHGSGIIVVDPDVDAPEYTRVVATVFP